METRLRKPQDVALELDVSIYTLKDWIRKNKVKAVKVVGQWRIPQEEVDRLRKGE